MIFSGPLKPVAPSNLNASSQILRHLCVLAAGLCIVTQAGAAPSNAGNVGVIATDDESNTGYTGSWGTPVTDPTHYGFGSWTNDGNGGSGGFFNGTSNGNDNGTGGLTNIDSTNGKSWGMFTGGAGIVDAFRSFTDVTSAQATASTLQIGQTLRFDMDNGNIATSNSVGFSLRNATGQNVFEFFFTGGGSDYSYNDSTGVHTTTIPFTRAGLRTEFTMTSATTYTFSIYAGGTSTTPLQTITGGTIPISGTSPGTIIATLRPFSNSGQTGSAADAFFNTDQILLPTFVGGSGNNWSTAANWSGAGITGKPVNGNSIAFNGTPASLTSNNDALTSFYNISFNGTATPITNGPTTTNAGAYTLTGNALTINGGVDNNSTNTQTINIPLTLGAAQSFNATNGNLVFGGTTLTNGGFRLTVAGANNTSISNAISGAGDLLKQGAGTLTLSGNSTGWAANNTGTNGTNTNTNIFIDQGTVAAAANNAFGATNGTSTGLIALGSSAIANLTSSILINTGGVTVGNPIDARYFNTIGGSGTTGAETIGGSNTTGTATYSGVLTLHNNLSIVAATGGSVAFTNTIIPGTAASPYANEAVNGTPGVTIGGGGNNGVVSFSGTGANMYTGTTVVNSGELDLNKTGVQAMGGNLTISGGTVKWLQSNQLVNNANVLLSSGTLNLNGQSQTVNDLNNSGGTFMTGAGTWTGTGASMTWGGGMSTVNTGGSVFENHLTITAGTNEIQAGGLVQLSLTGLSMNGGTVTIDSDPTTPGKLALMSNVSVTDGTTTSAINSSSPTNPGVVDLSNGTRTFAVGTTTASTSLGISASIISTGSIIKSGAGSLNLTGNNTYSGTTTINAGTINAGAVGALGGTSSVTVNSTGTLLLSGAGNLNRVNDSAGISLGGGTLARTGSASEGSGATIVNGSQTGGTNAIGLGALTLTAASNLDFGTGVGTLVFASFTPAGNTLNILDYTNSHANVATNSSGVDGSDDRLIFHQDEASNLGDFNFGSGISATEIALGGGYFEITAVPEPSTWAAGGLAVLGVLIFSRRRQLVRRGGR